MNINLTKLVISSIAGFLSAVVTDLSAFGNASDGSAFDWKLAVVRWIRGAITGFMTGAGLSQIGGN